MKKLFILLVFTTMVSVPVAMFQSCGEVEPEKPDDPQSVLINGVIWSKTNVNVPGTFAAEPEDAGMFYQWGKNVGWSATDPLISSEDDTTWDTSVVSGKVWLSFFDPCPEGWRVPTEDDFWALWNPNKVSSIWTKQGGVDGRLFIDVATEESLFLPAAGYRAENGYKYGQSMYGYYWSSEGNSNSNGFSLYLSSSEVFPIYSANYANGFAVRCVMK